ncbi:hypothetical protein B566_EDAN013163 [Ephemera danica]|nr:hypothetical protein B566_EDAN013163 [Ephemera danica]
MKTHTERTYSGGSRNGRLKVNGDTLEIKEASDGDTGKFYCKLETYSGGSRNGRLKVNGDTLEIKEASDGDTGKFYCKLEYTPIEPLLSMKTDLDVSDESQLKLLCQTKAHPQAKIRWEVALIGGGEMTSVDESKGRYNLKVYNGVPNSQLVINQASKDDQGNYTCMCVD